MPIAKKTIPKNGGGKGRKTHPINRLITPPTINTVDFKCRMRCKSAISWKIGMGMGMGMGNMIIAADARRTKRMFQDNFP
ncbi:hypothetical protein [Thalassospira alkalitolerans]|uniref:hypothetical protein n=1 Tax=Thalassospira alkalitolerans TaxID=1293890 RepID=UPI003AA8D162